MDASLCKAFFWKNFLFLKSNWQSSLILNMACVVIFYIYCKSTYHVVTTPTNVFESKNTEDLKSYFPGNSADFVYFSPVNAFLDDLMEKVRIDLFLTTERIKPFNDSVVMNLAQKTASSGNSFAIAFTDWPTHNAEGTIRYKISSPVTRPLQKTRYINDKDANGIIENDEYVQSGYLTLQHAIDMNFVKSVNSRSHDYEMEISPLPILGFESAGGERVKIVGLLFAVLFNVILISIVLVPVVEEKQDGIKEFLVLATPYNFLNGLTFFCVRFLVSLPFIFVCIAIASVYEAIGLTSTIYYILLVLHFCVASTCYTFLISIFFKTVFYAKVGGFLLLILPFFFYLVEGKLSMLISIIFATTSFLNGLSVLQIFTNKHCQFSTNELFLDISDTNPSVFVVLTILLFQCCFYTILYNYLSRVFPGKGGLKQPLLYFLKSNRSIKNDMNQFMSNEHQPRDIAVIIQDLVKFFRTKNRTIKIADKLCMKIKDRTITVLLGHNGAGKTTLLNMIIGCIPKDSGKIIVCSEREVLSYRHLIGFCPQHCMYMQYMTCYQHFRFFAQIRGKSDAEADSLASELLTKLKLVNKAKEYAKNLSGGMKRRLSLGIALSGETKIVILDEPSSGLDVESRRELWDVLLEIRKSKAVLITTHHMEEAEILGDTISILSNGKLEQSGSPLELKRQYGSGYVLKLQTETHFNRQRTLDIIQSSMPTAQIIRTILPSVLIRMPYSFREQYSTVLENLETSRKNLGITSITVTDTSLEEVFLNSQAPDVVDSHDQENERSVNIPYQKLSNSVEWTKQFHAIFYKKLIFITNQWIGSLVMFCLPFLAIGVAIIVMRSLSLNDDENSMRLSLKHFQNGFIYLRETSNNTELMDVLRSEIENNGIHTKALPPGQSFEKELIRQQSNNLYDYFEHAIGAVSIDRHENKFTFRIYYSTNIVHSSVILVNLIDNVILKFATSMSNSIETIYEPSQRITEVSPKKLEYFAAIVPIGFFLYMLYYVALPFRENKTEFKNLQAIPRATYWISFFIFDAILHSIICLFCFLFQYVIVPSNLYSHDYQIVLIFTYFFYGLSYLPLLYCFTIGFKSISPLSTYLFFMFIMSSIVPFITSSNVKSMENFECTIMITSILPDFSLSHQLRVINEHFIMSLTQTNQRNGTDRSELPSLSTFFIYAVLKIIIFKIFLIYIWDNMIRIQCLKDSFLCCRSRRNRETNELLDREDEMLVQKERGNVEQIIRSNETDQYPLLVQNLHKFYGKAHAVRGVNFAITKQECFGLLGVNGAGKTSTFQMITANLPISNGHIYIDGYSVEKQESLYKYRFGYCPQGDCLANFMTAYQILKYMAILRNINTSDIQEEVSLWLSQLDLLKYQNVPIRYYSGGTKRKLNAAIAMIGNPSLVLLDEPTTGVDPISRRLLWKCIQNFQNRGKTIVLTSHSLDECEHLCNRLAIMANGKLQCIGSIPYLKEKYGSGFTINVKLLNDCPANKTTNVTLALQEQFDCILREHHAGMLTYFVNDKTILWSDVFKRTEEFFRSCNDLVQDYSISETTLEDIFLKFDEKYQKYLNENEMTC